MWRRFYLGVCYGYELNLHLMTQNQNKALHIQAQNKTSSSPLDLNKPRLSLVEYGFDSVYLD